MEDIPEKAPDGADSPLPADNARLASFRAAGQSLWLDSLSRRLLRSGELDRLIAAGITGVTSNPTIFAQAFRSRDDYAEDVARFAAAGLTPRETYERLVTADVREAAERLLPVWRRSERWDGCVSVEVSPDTADDEDATLAEAERWWREVAHPNVMIKVPATAAGLRAMQELVRRGRSINVTLIFGLDQYEATIEAWLSGLERRRQEGRDLGGIACVASLFLSRVDTAIDAQLEALDDGHDRTAALHGRAALALARLAYERFRRLNDDPRWAELRHAGASVQRLLWASTGTKDPRLADTHYVDPLALPGTVNTLPAKTLRAAMAHGRADGGSLVSRADAERTVAELASLGVSLPAVARELQVQGLGKFADSYAEAVRCVTYRAPASPAPHQATSHQATPHQATPHQATPHQATPHQERIPR
jgi:transaldolase